MEKLENEFTLTPSEKDVVKRFLLHMLQEFIDDGDKYLRMSCDAYGLTDEQIKWIIVGKIDGVELLIHHLQFIRTQEQVEQEIIRGRRLINGNEQ
jgi:esterase/lipase superfamily enzyme